MWRRREANFQSVRCNLSDIMVLVYGLLPLRHLRSLGPSCVVHDFMFNAGSIPYVDRPLYLRQSRGGTAMSGMKYS